MDELKYLDISKNKVKEGGPEVLFKCSFLCNLTTINLTEIKIKFDLLTKFDYLRDLKFL